MCTVAVQQYSSISRPDELSPTSSKTKNAMQVPQFLLIGASEILSSATSLEFYYEEAPPTMRGVSAGLNLLTTALGSWITVPLLKLVGEGTGNVAASSLPSRVVVVLVLVGTPVLIALKAAMTLSFSRVYFLMRCEKAFLQIYTELPAKRAGMKRSTSYKEILYITRPEVYKYCTMC